MANIRIGLVACSKTKASRPAQARDLYTGTLFKRASAYAERMCDVWYVLSAKHGLVHPDTALNPYDVSLYDMSKQQRLEWAANVLAALRELGFFEPPMFHSAGEMTRWLILAGKRYRKFLVPGLIGERIEIPLAGMGIGQQIEWLDEALLELSTRCRMCEVAIPTRPDGLCCGCRDYVRSMRIPEYMDFV